jgi:hypothetical protein
LSRLTIERSYLRATITIRRQGTVVLKLRRNGYYDTSIGTRSVPTLRSISIYIPPVPERSRRTTDLIVSSYRCRFLKSLGKTSLSTSLLGYPLQSTPEQTAPITPSSSSLTSLLSTRYTSLLTSSLRRAPSRTSSLIISSDLSVYYVPSFRIGAPYLQVISRKPYVCYWRLIGALVPYTTLRRTARRRGRIRTWSTIYVRIVATTKLTRRSI